MGLPKPPSALVAGYGATGFDVFPAGFGLALVKSFLGILLFLPSESVYPVCVPLYC